MTTEKEAGEEPEVELSQRRGRGNRGGWRKQKGEMAESEFLAKAVSLGFGVAKPWGDSGRYDFIVDAGGRLGGCR